MAETLNPDLCVIGAGSGGLSVAAAAAQLGVEVVLIEKAKMGGDCLNYGCVPSKAMIAAGKHAQAMRNPEAFGIAGVEPRIDPRKVHDHVHGVIAAIAPNDSVERFTGMGVRVIEAEGRFKDARTVEAGGHEIKARRFVIATGSSPAAPPIPGIDKVPYFTNETIFDVTETIPHLLIIGGGPIGMELAQAHRRLGSRVTVLEAFTPLGKDDPELTAVVLKRLAEEGVEIQAGIRIEKLERSQKGVRAHITVDDEASEIEGSHLLVAAGRAPNVDGLDLEAAGINFDKKGIKVSSRLKTSNSRVYAIGDVAGSLQFTHMANYHAGLVIRNALFRLPVKASTTAIPWVTYTDPELAHVGLTEAQAREKSRNVQVLRWPYGENDRAQAEHETEGFIKVVVGKRGRILGATIVGARAGELIQTWVLAIIKNMKIGDMTSIVVAYPTLSEINKRVAYTYYLPSLTNPWIRRIIGFLRMFG
ncbi:MAG: FAD-dependent oxidoreductase [Hyphomicrobiales bacterium]|nr:FAD-dependent oxidoreductase [Hyphomicrobiales bacterium]